MFRRKRKTEAPVSAGASGPSVVDPVKAAKVSRRNKIRWAVIAAAGSSMFASGWGMWHFFEHKIGEKQLYMLIPMFGVFDLAGIACALSARANKLDHGQRGWEGAGVWVFAVLSGFMSASDAGSWQAGAARFAIPLVAAAMFELLIKGERADAVGEKSNGVLAKLIRRAKARLGLLRLDQDDEAAAKAAAVGRLASLAYAMHQTKAGSWSRRRAVARYHRKLRWANETLGMADDAEMIGSVRAHLASLYQSITGTTEDAVADLNLWRAADRAVPGKYTPGSSRVADREVLRELPGNSGTGQPGELTGKPLVVIDPALPGVPPLTEFPGSAGQVAAAGQNGGMSDEEIIAVYGEQLRAKGVPVPPGRVRAMTPVGGPRSKTIADKINATL
jgi:hypothetical protein